MEGLSTIWEAFVYYFEIAKIYEAQNMDLIQQIQEQESESFNNALGILRMSGIIDQEGNVDSEAIQNLEESIHGK